MQIKWKYRFFAFVTLNTENARISKLIHYFQVLSWLDPDGLSNDQLVEKVCSCFIYWIYMEITANITMWDNLICANLTQRMGSSIVQVFVKQISIFLFRSTQ